MPQVQEAKLESYFGDFSRLKRRGAEPAWLESARERAMERFGEVGFPTTRHEAWRFTNLSSVARTPFSLAEDHSAGTTALPILPPDAASARLVVTDGFVRRDLSSLDSLPRGVTVTSLSEALKTSPARLENRLARYAEGDQALIALNTAFFQDGALVEIGAGVVLEKPIHVLWVRAAGSEGSVSHPRTLIVAGRESQSTVMETYIGSAGDEYFTNAVTEIIVGENASLDHVKLQQEGERAFHVGTVQAYQERASRFHSHSVSLGAALARHDIQTVLAGEGAECTLNGVYQVSGRQHVDHHTKLDHAAAHCSSREYYRGILDGKSSGVFSGAIIVRKDAQKTDAIQSNKNLLLSEEATINTKPELQILADDVRCTHGATIGQLDEEALFYLRARGIGMEAARHLLIRAFANDVIARVRDASVRQRLESELLARLSAGWKSEEVL